MSCDDTKATAQTVDANHKDIFSNESTGKPGTKSTDTHNKDQFRVQVQSQYLVDERPSILSPIAPIPDSSIKHDNKDGNKSKKNRGQNKKRPRDAKINCSQKACLQIIKGETCSFENCKYNHDLKEMMANRAVDLSEEEGLQWLQGECPNWKLRG